VGGDDGLGELRRRLYAPDATDADIAAYRAAQEGRDRESGAEAAPSARRSRRRTVVIAGASLLAATVLVLTVGHPFAGTPPSPSPSAVSGRITVPPSVREGFRHDLATGVDPGLLAYLDGHPAGLLEALRTAGRADSTEFTGTGPTTLPLSPTTIAEQAGHVTVVLVTDRAVGYDWRATVVAEGNDRSGPEPPVAVHAGRARAGEPVSGTVGYSGGVPTGLTLLLPTGARWAAVVVYTD
jgi:hypothetical protein